MKNTPVLKHRGILAIPAPSLLILMFFQLVSLKATTLNTPVTLSFSLKTASVTSAGIFTRKNQLIRTLWSNVRLGAGQHTRYWDGLDDNGAWVKDTGLIFRVLSGNVKYTWEGTIGNNSDSMTGSSKMRSFERINTLAISGSYAYYGTGYAEGVPSCYKFALSAPHKKINILNSGNGDVDQECVNVCADAGRVYWAGYDPYSSGNHFIYATQISNDSEYLFSSGRSLSMTYGRTYLSAVGITDNDPDAINTGLGVQKNGNLLFAAQGKKNRLLIIDKTNGELLNQLNHPAITALSIGLNDELWAIENQTSIKKITFDNKGNVLNETTVFSGLKEALALTVQASNGNLYVIEGGDLQQVLVFNSQGTLLKNIGQKGGYINDANVEDNKYYFSDSATGLSKPYIAMEPDGSYWLGDVGNERLLKNNSNDNLLDFILYLPHSYSTVADKNNLKRVFNQYLEFEVDLSKTPSQAGSWKLVRNWRRYIPANYHQADMMGIFRQASTLSNGSTYAILDRFENGIRKPEIVEIPLKGRLRFTGIVLADFARDVITSSGSLRRTVCSRNLGDSGHFEEQALLGFDAQRNPIWANPVVTASIPVIGSADPSYNNIGSLAVSGSGYHLVFSPGKENQGYHLGAIKAGEKQWLWKTCPSTHPAYTGPMPNDGRFDIGNGVVYPGGDVFAEGSNIFWNYHGEFWKNSQTNIWNHYHECGLMITQFGITSPQGERAEAFAMGAGNVFSSSLVNLNGELYIYHNDESVHSGIHRWKISDLNSILITDYSISNRSDKQNLRGLKGEFFKTKDLDAIGLFMETHCKNPSELNAKKFSSIPAASARWTGYINSNTPFQLNVSSQGEYRIFLADTLFFSKKKQDAETQTLPMLLPGINSSFKIETDAAPVKLQLLVNNQPVALPDDFFRPEAFSSDNDINLLYGLRPYTVTENNTYGWSGDLNSNNDVFSCLSGFKSQKPDNDIAFSFLSGSESKSVSRNLRGIEPCGTWSINGWMNLEGNFPDYTDNKMEILVLDTNERTIATIENTFINLEAYQYPTKITCNGEEIINQPYNQMYSWLNVPVRFGLQFKSDGLVFSYGNLLPLNIRKQDPASDPMAPGRVLFRFSGGSSSSRKALSLSELKVIGAGRLRIQSSDKDSICQGYNITLASPNASGQWSNGSSEKEIVVTETGVFVLVSSGACRKSDTFHVQVMDLPDASVKREKDSLVNFTPAILKIWKFNNRTIAINQDRIKPDSSGLYTLTVTNISGCENTGSYTYSSTGVTHPGIDKTQVYPNPSEGWIWIHSESEKSINCEISDETGRFIRAFALEGSQQIRLEHSGIYLIKIESQGELRVFKVINILSE